MGGPIENLTDLCAHTEKEVNHWTRPTITHILIEYVSVNRVGLGA